MSFGQELKDFVTGARHGYEMASHKRDKQREYDRNLVNDEVENAAKKANTDKVLLGNKWYERIAADELATNASRRAAVADQLKWSGQLNQSLIDTRRAAILNDALGLNSTGKPPEMLDGEAPEGDPEDYLNLSSNMGIPLPDVRHVQYAAEGGLIEEEEEPVAGIGAALPVEAPIPPERPVTSEGTPEGAGDASPAARANPRIAGFEKAHEAVMEGLNYSLQQMGVGSAGAVEDPSRAAAMANYLKGAGAAPQSLIKQAEQIVDPNGELSESERTMGTLGTVYNHYLKQGDSEKAKKAAASIVQYQRRLFSTYASIAQAAAENGDVDQTVEAAIRAYSSVPDGRDLKVSKTEDGRFQVEITDEATGEVIQKPVLSPQEIGAWAMKVTPGSFDEYIAGAAGERKPTSQGFKDMSRAIDEGEELTNEQLAGVELEEGNALRARMKDRSEGAAKPPTRTEIAKAQEDIGAMWETLASEADAEGNATYPGMAETAPKEKRIMQQAAADIMLNPRNIGDSNVTPADAIDAASHIALTRNFQQENEKGGKRVTLPDERSFWIPMAQYRQLDNIFKSRAAGDLSKKRQDKARAERDAAADRIDMEETRARVNANRATAADPWTGMPGASAIPMQGIDNDAQAALDRMETLLGQR
jgi:hypothetical protein